MLAISILFFAIAYVYVNVKDKRKLKAICNLQSQTEEAEGINFQIHLYEDESEGRHQEKINSLFEIAESRRAYNNERLRTQMKKAQEEAKETLANLKK